MFLLINILSGMTTRIMKNIIILIAFLFSIQSCGDKVQNTTTKIPVADTTNQSLSDTQPAKDTGTYTEMNDEPDEDDFTYPQKGSKASDFLPENTLQDYEIQYEASGDLNNDDLADIVVILKNMEVKTALRPMLVLLQNNDKTYRLDKVSNLVIPAEYTENDFQMYSSENLSIEKGTILINLYGSGGPIGNTFSHFKYFGNDLVLTYIETYNIGAGSWQNLYFDLEKGELTEEITNTMKEDMPSESKTFQLKKEIHLFEKTSPDQVIMDAYKKIDSNW